MSSFAAKGFYGTSMDDIAEELLLTRGSLYYYFRDKEEILALCHETANQAMLDVTERVRASALPPDQALRRIIVEHARVMVDKFHGTALALQFDALDARRRATVVGVRDAYENEPARRDRGGRREGVFRPVDPKIDGVRDPRRHELDGALVPRGRRSVGGRDRRGVRGDLLGGLRANP